MEQIELFDNYITGTLTQEQILEFEKRLEEDKEFSKEFHLYIAMVNGIRKEEEQDCIEFGHAMKSLTKDKLLEIVGKKEKPKANIEEPKLDKVINFQRYLWPLSTAAIIVIAFTITFNIERKSRYAMDDMLYSYNEPMFANRGGEDLNISNCNDDELRAMLPALQTIYQNSETTQEALINGKGLAMVYVKLHERDKAKIILQELIDKYHAEEEYAEAVEECRRLLSQLEQ